MNSYKSHLRRKHADVDLKAAIDSSDEVCSPDTGSVEEDLDIDQVDGQNDFINEDVEECDEEEKKRLDALYVL